MKLVFDSTSYEPSSFIGTTPSYLTAHSYKLAEGSSFTSADVSSHRRVAVIGQTVVEELFAGQSASRPEHEGQRHRTSKSSACSAAKGSNGATNQDDVVMAPISTVQDSLTGFGAIDSITVQARSPNPR